jgi:hypothetical protein
MCGLFYYPLQLWRVYAEPVICWITTALRRVLGQSRRFYSRRVVVWDFTRYTLVGQTRSDGGGRFESAYCDWRGWNAAQR